jgi:hypothetical protein
MRKKYKKAHSLLKKLPPVFSNKDFALFTDIPIEQIQTYLYRWVKEGFIVPLGGKSGVYFKDEEAKNQYFAQAIHKVFPEAVLIGASVMNQENLTTQIPHCFNIAIRKRQFYPKIDETIIHLRKKSWYSLIRRKEYVKFGYQSLPFLVPEFALADMLKFRDGWVPDPDDIEFDEMDSDLFDRACKDLSLDPQIKDRFLNYYQEKPLTFRGGLIKTDS